MSNPLSLSERYKAAYESLFSRQSEEMQKKIVSAKGSTTYDKSVTAFIHEVAELAEGDKIILAPKVYPGNPS